jgi:hypothetical protein
LKKFLLFGILTLGSSWFLKKNIRSLRKFNVVILELTCDLPLAIFINIVKIWSIMVKLITDYSLPYKNLSAIYF